MPAQPSPVLTHVQPNPALSLCLTPSLLPFQHLCLYLALESILQLGLANHPLQCISQTLHLAQIQFLPSVEENLLSCPASPRPCCNSVLPARVTLRNSLCHSNLIKSSKNQATRIYYTRPCLDPRESVSSCPTSQMDPECYVHKFRDSCLLSEAGWFPSTPCSCFFSRTEDRGFSHTQTPQS